MSRSLARKIALSAFITVCLVTQVLQNLAVGYPTAPADAPYPVRVATWVGASARWGFDTFGFWTGTNTFWRMFSPVHKYDWWWTVTALYPDGSARSLPSPSAANTAPAPFFIDFRETKLLLNLWNRPQMQAAYADHLCRQEAAAGRPPQRIRLDVTWRAIVAPDLAARTGSHSGPQVNTRTMGEFACSGTAPR